MPTQSRRASPLPQTPARKTLLYWLSGAALGLVLAAAVGLAMLNPAINPALGGGRGPGSGSARLSDGSWPRAYERRFEEGLAVRGPAVAFWALLRYGLFAEGNRGLLIGSDGWLFTAEEFQEARELDASLQVDEAAVREVREGLAGRGVRLVVALVPAKARVYPEKLGRYTLPAGAADRYRKVQGLLARIGVPAPDLLAPLQEARRGGEVFLRSDTHWTPLGAGIAAEALAETVNVLLSEAGSSRSRFASSEGPPQEYPGDLLHFLPLGPFRNLGPRPDLVRPRLTAALEQSAESLFDQPAIPVVLVGTSYSAGELWNLEGALKTELEADVLNVAKQGQGPLAPMRALLAGPVLKDVRADVVVWEIPERYFRLP